MDVRAGRARLRIGAFAAAAAIAVGACTASEPVATPTETPSSASPKPTRTRTPSPTPTKTRERPPPLPEVRSGPVHVTRAPCGAEGAPRIVRFRVEVDAGLRTTPNAFARALRDVLCDARGWIASEAVRFRYDPDGSLLIGVRTPDNAERRCYDLIRLSVNRFYSCGTPSEVVLNGDRWFGGSPYWPGPLEDYRRMLTNHEVGHAMLLHHTECPRDGARAPIMMQQSKGMNLNGNTCRPNPWPLARELDLLR